MASMSCSTFRVVISGAAEMPSLLQGLEDVHNKLGTGNMEGMKTSMISGVFRRRLTWWVSLVPAQWGLELLSLRSRSVNAPSAYTSPMASLVGWSLVCLFSLSQNSRTGLMGRMLGAGSADLLHPDLGHQVVLQNSPSLTLSSGHAQMLLVVALLINPM